jgi:hypothetical protein
VGWSLHRHIAICQNQWPYVLQSTTFPPVTPLIGADRSFLHHGSLTTCCNTNFVKILFISFFPKELVFLNFVSIPYIFCTLLLCKSPLNMLYHRHICRSARHDDVFPYFPQGTKRINVIHKISRNNSLQNALLFVRKYSGDSYNLYFLVANRLKLGLIEYMPLHFSKFFDLSQLFGDISLQLFMYSRYVIYVHL